MRKAPACLPRVIGMHCDSGVAKHCLGTCRGDHDLGASILERVRERREHAELDRLSVSRHVEKGATRDVNVVNLKTI